MEATKRKNQVAKKEDHKKNQSGTEPKTVTVHVLFVQQTVGGELARRLKAAEEDLSILLKDKVKIVEQTGRTIKSVLVKADPSSAASCGRDKCVICLDEKQHGTCKVRSVTYQTSCQTCTGQGRKAVYIGESSRSVYERSLEHLEDYKTEKEESHMYTHAIEAHSKEEKPLFAIKVLRKHRSALYRQVHEAVLIAKHHPITLNSKLEYNRCLLPRLTVMMGRKNVEDRENLTGGEKHIEEEKILESNYKRKEKADPEKPPKRKKRKTEMLKHRKITEILRNQVEKSPRKRRRSNNEDDEENPSPLKSKKQVNLFRKKTVEKADPHTAEKTVQINKKTDQIKKKADPHSASKATDRYTSRSNPENKTPEMPAKKKSEENSDNKAPTSTTKKIPPLNSHFFTKKCKQKLN